MPCWKKKKEIEKLEWDWLRGGHEVPPSPTRGVVMLLGGLWGQTGGHRSAGAPPKRGGGGE